MQENLWYMSLRSKELRDREPSPSWLSPLESSFETADDRTELFHYTNIEALMKIASLGTIKFSRIDKLNDPLEKDSLVVNEYYKRVFLASFTYEKEESIPMWKMYTPKGFGVRITYNTQESEQ